MTASIAERAAARAKELARLRTDLAAGHRLTKADVALAVERAEQSRERAEAARRRAIAAYERAAGAHDRAASAHEHALAQGRGNATAHERAVVAHRAAARLDRLAAQAAEKDCSTSTSEGCALGLSPAAGTGNSQARKPQGRSCRSHGDCSMPYGWTGSGRPVLPGCLPFRDLPQRLGLTSS
ncbi:hypothetical protein [Nocardia brasiliensis]|uniref:hypothetical protein n=1 Tax=Nocardia brasiliensis TaxID=37326 RepID=UPI002458938B|nr:hypothetical protein [Nocardia brasiliensis]